MAPPAFTQLGRASQEMPTLRPDTNTEASMPYRGALFDKINMGFSKTESDRQPGLEGWDAMPATDMMRPMSARETGVARSPSRLTGKLTYGLSNDQKCWSAPCQSWGPVPRPVSAASGERRPNHMDPPLRMYEQGPPHSFPRNGRPCSAGSLGESFRASHRGRTPPSTTTWERGGPRGGTPIGSICQQLHLIKATKGQSAGLSRIVGKPGGGLARSPRSRREERRDSEDSDTYIILPTADPNRRLSDYERGFLRTGKNEESEEEYQLGPRQKQEIEERQQRWSKISNQMETLEHRLDMLDNRLSERQASNEYHLPADIRRSAVYVRERINNLQRDIVIEEKLQPPPQKLPKAVMEQLRDEFLEVHARVESGASRVTALETRIYIQQKNVREGKPISRNHSHSPEPKPKAK